MPLPKSSKRENLKSIGAEELWVEVRLMSGMPYKLVRELLGDGIDENVDEYEKMKSLVEALIVDWNIPAEDGGEVLPLPSVNRNVLDDLPLAVVNFISGLVSEDTSITTASNL